MQMHLVLQKKIKSGIKRFKGQVSINDKDITKNKKKIKVQKIALLKLVNQVI